MFLGPSLGVNRMWTKRNDHALESEIVASIEYLPSFKKLWKKTKKKSSLIILLSFLVFVFFSLKKNH